MVNSQPTGPHVHCTHKSIYTHMSVNSLHTLVSSKQGQANKTFSWVSALQTACHSSHRWPFRGMPEPAVFSSAVPNAHGAAPQLMPCLIYIFPYIQAITPITSSHYLRVFPKVCCSVTGFTRAVYFMDSRQYTGNAKTVI